MTWPQIITTETGEKLVVLPQADYERLVELAEDAADVAAADAVMKRVDIGEDEFIPAEMVDRILEGEPKIKVWREYRGMTVGELASAAGVDQSELSAFEPRPQEAPRPALERIAKALRVDLEDLI
ncbi:helix-turn-helix domain-containing protein [Jiella sp. M17.18]|uniref:helix-turn-helix domain-containing protein n=1 Tax=Jiella sp. M17.18 TaxID=3234247 RepID=UPI0034DF9BE7